MTHAHTVLAGAPGPARPAFTLADGIALHQAGELSQAKEAYLALLRAEPDNADAWHLLGVIALQLGEAQAAVPLIARAIELDPKQAAYFNNLANALFELHKLEDAEAVYRSAIELQPDYAEAIYNLGNTLQILERYDEAQTCYERAVALNPSYADAMYSAARLRQTRGDYSAAAAWYAQILDVDPGYRDAHFHLGRLLFLEQRLHQAQHHYEQYKRLDKKAPAVIAPTRHLLLPLTSVKQWCAHSGARYECIRSPATQPVAAPQFGDPSPMPISASTGMLNELYLAEVADASVTGWSDVVLAGGRSVALYDMATRNPDDAIEVEHGPAHYVSSNHALVDGYRNNGKPLERGILLSGRGRDSYAHWLIDFLPRLWLVDQFSEYDHWPLLIDVGLYPQQLESLQRLNRKDRPLVVLSNDTGYDVARLVVVSDPSAMRRQSYRPFARPSGDDVTVPTEALQYLRSGFLPDGDSGPVRRLYVSRRRQTRFRRLQNEAEVEQVFVAHGFEVVYPELLPHAQQVKLFSEADVIAGAAGSNMINTVFSPQGARIIMLAQWNPGLNYYFFPHLAQLLGQQLTYVLGDIAQRHNYHYQHDFVVDIARLTRTLRQVL